ncbi:hypothetical protein PENSPDRAFT_695761 [Peniophora sp. CONT]|nr:hypothetical protein PENSPDRAFT_695761 [Peniophora sp. CONT]
MTPAEASSDEFQAVSFAGHGLISSHVFGSEALTFSVDIFRQPVKERHARVGDVVCFHPSSNGSTSGDTMPMGVLTWIEPSAEIGEDRLCGIMEIFTKKRLCEMMDDGEIVSNGDLGQEFDQAPGYTAWLSDSEDYYAIQSIFTVPSMKETRYHVRFASFEWYLNVDEEANTYRLEKTVY